MSISLITSVVARLSQYRANRVHSSGTAGRQIERNNPSWVRRFFHPVLNPVRIPLCSAQELKTNVLQFISLTADLVHHIQSWAGGTEFPSARIQKHKKHPVMAKNATPFPQKMNKSCVTLSIIRHLNRIARRAFEKCYRWWWKCRTSPFLPYPPSWQHFTVCSLLTFLIVGPRRWWAQTRSHFESSITFERDMMDKCQSVNDPSII